MTEAKREAPSKSELTGSALIKLSSGGMLTVEELSALFDISPATVRGLPIDSIRIGRSLRFEAATVAAFINASRQFAI